MRSFLSYPFLLLAAFIPFSTADYIVNSPTSGQIFNKGDQLSASWTSNSEADKVVSVNLTYGDPTNLQLAMVMCKDIDPKVGQCNYTIGDLPSRRDYSVAVGNSYIGYSSYFVINSTGPLPPPSGCPNFGGHDCPASLPCCSSSGFCGNSDEYCGTGCDPAHSFNGQCIKAGQSSPATNSTPPDSTTPQDSTTPPSTINTCGDAMCNVTYPCCSQFKFCGDTDVYCGQGCDPSSSFNGQCVIPNQPNQ
ncbi:polysaccharide deacetylase family protein [Gigaspora margarita]|uniref:Polysaccharide deacetylase family protein n=1 Tax=Gigaspora margarita TaxID=4874 RepID=A0A8H4B2H1_GIGMA|nr:polysaccharide deacetylase family protein [Gigaspora margarita]